MNTQARTPWTAIALFTVLALGLGWAVAIPLWSDPTNPVLAQITASAMMFTPTLAVVIVALATRRRSFWRFVGAWPLRPVGRTIWFSVAAILGPIVLTVAGIAVSAALGFVDLDLETFSGFAAQLEATGVDTSGVPLGVVALTQLAMVPFAAILPNGLLAFGEELAWRGWLTSALRPRGVWPTLIITGVIWGVWHAPLTLLGHDYGRLDVTGVLFMVVNCVTMGMLLGWVRLRSGSLWPAVFAHGALNAVGNVIFVVASAESSFDLALVAPTGLAMWIVVFAVVAILAACGQYRSGVLSVPSLDKAPRGVTGTRG